MFMVCGSLGVMQNFQFELSLTSLEYCLTCIHLKECGILEDWMNYDALPLLLQLFPLMFHIHCNYLVLHTSD